MEAIGIFSQKKKVITVPGHERFDVPLVEKKKAQILSVSGDRVSIMDLESYETLELGFMEELREKLESGKQVEYWDIEGKKVIMRVV